MAHLRLDQVAGDSNVYLLNMRESDFRPMVCSRRRPIQSQHADATRGSHSEMLTSSQNVRLQMAMTINLPENGTADKLEWSQGGNVLSVSTTQGAIHSYLMKVPCLSANWDTRVVNLTSLRELSIVDTAVVPARHRPQEPP